MKKISFIFGTRPEAIKLCPLVLEMRTSSCLEPLVCVTGQHREMLDQVLQVFGVTPDVDLDLMRPNQSLASLTARSMSAIDDYLTRERPDMVIAQGDTTTVLCAALSAFYHKIPVGHVEAGLRTGNKFSPFPEETNRVLTSHLADLHFAPTKTAESNLAREGIDAADIYVTGNTVIDSLMFAIGKVRQSPPHVAGLPAALQPGVDGPLVILITGHRRENLGDGFESICHAIAELAERWPEKYFVYPVHLNPRVREPVERILASSRVPNVHLIEPLPYLQFVAMIERSYLVLTDSGGVQEEAPSLGKPVLVMRDTTERPEAVELGTVRLVGADMDKIVDGVSLLLTDGDAYGKMAQAVNPYGDGKACQRIVNIIEQRLV